MTRLVALCTLILISACSTTSQTTSGGDWLAARSAVVDPEIAAAAAVEPDLRLPARIGVARVVNGQITAIPADEIALMSGINSAGARFGSFTAVSPMIAQTIETDGRPDALRLARLTAARQHLDYVLVYDLSAQGRGIGATGMAQAILLDVRNGYPYGTATASAQNVRTMRTRGYYGARGLSDESARRVTRALVPEVRAMLTALADS
ncbi:hypothetical protein [Octadecabacter sp. R77987]|uniref:hypothetical protein n=1 Tax=Octadecabacter sp. R77987 TaxID=3093874 RepID=UPI003671DB20